LIAKTFFGPHVKSRRWSGEFLWLFLYMVTVDSLYNFL
jgi:hypothetical protein